MGTLLVPMGFAVFGLLLGWQAADGLGAVVGIGGGLLFGAVAVLATAGSLAVANAPLRARPALLLQSVGEGAWVLVPFVVLAVIADLGLQWRGSQVFAASGLMATVSACGAAAAKRSGAAGAASTLLPMLTGGGLMALWMGLGSLLCMLARL